MIVARSEHLSLREMPPARSLPPGGTFFVASAAPLRVSLRKPGFAPARVPDIGWDALAPSPRPAVADRTRSWNPATTSAVCAPMRRDGLQRGPTRLSEMTDPTPMELLQRSARLVARTTRVMGVDFLPVGLSSAGDTDANPTAGLADAAPRPAPPARVAVPVVGASRESKARALAGLRQEHDASCPHCTKATAHTQTVFGDGDPDARLMFVGEAPGAEEDRLGIPFVGASGKKLNEMIVAMGLSRERVYIANVLKARPPNNDTPTAEEAARCGPYLLRQIRIINPTVIVTLGKPAANFLLENREPMSSLRGRWAAFEGIPVMPTFHPAFLLRQYTPENRQRVWSDLKQAMERLRETGGV